MVPRHLFVPESVRHRAYEDAALPIGGGQTISQPWVQARYLELLALTGTERVLEIGTGSGYQTALLALLADAVFAVERIPALAQSARAALEAAGIATSPCWWATAPWAGARSRRTTRSWWRRRRPRSRRRCVEQLAPGGRLVIPLGDRDSQVLTLARREGDQLRTSTVADVRFVPLLGEFGFSS